MKPSRPMEVGMPRWRSWERSKREVLVWVRVLGWKAWDPKAEGTYWGVLPRKEPQIGARLHEGLWGLLAPVAGVLVRRHSVGVWCCEGNVVRKSASKMEPTDL